MIALCLGCGDDELRWTVASCKVQLGSKNAWRTKRGWYTITFSPRDFFWIRWRSYNPRFFHRVTTSRHLVKHHCRRCSDVSIIPDNAIEVNWSLGEVAILPLFRLTLVPHFGCLRCRPAQYLAGTKPSIWREQNTGISQEPLLVYVPIILTHFQSDWSRWLESWGDCALRWSRAANQ